MTLRTIALITCLALSQAGCLAHSIAGIGSDMGATDNFTVAPIEKDAKLSCDGKPCNAAPLEQVWHKGRSRGLFWAVWAGEWATMAVALAAGVSGTSSGTLNTPAVVVADLAFILAITDLIAYIRADDYGQQREALRMPVPVNADWRGQQISLRLTDVVPPGTDAPPASFSIAPAALRLGPLPPSVPIAAPAPAPPPGARLTHGKLAVLELKSSAAELSANDVRYFGDLVRSATLRVAPQLQVMTRENLLVLLQGSGKDLASCEGECEVETGRRIGADAIVAGDLLKVGTRYKLTLRLYDTQEGRLLGAATASGGTIDQLDESTSKAVAELFGAAP